eukprot:scaffold4375_cov79-Skeletonema_marinoi.AAC.1
MNQVERELNACNSKYRYPQVKMKMGRVLLLAEAFNRRSRRKYESSVIRRQCIHRPPLSALPELLKSSQAWRWRSHAAGRSSINRSTQITPTNSFAIGSLKCSEWSLPAGLAKMEEIEMNYRLR